MSKNRMAVMAPALEHIAELIVFAFSDNISAENSKFSADSGIHGIQFLECMQSGNPNIFNTVPSLASGSFVFL